MGNIPLSGDYFHLLASPKGTLVKTVDVVGVDLGIKTLAYLSTGIVFGGSKAYKCYQKRLSRLQLFEPK